MKQEYIHKSKRRTVGEVSIDAQIIYALIKKCKIDDIVTYREISDEIGRDIQKHMGLLRTARAMSMRNDRMVFDCAMNVGIKRLDDDQIIKKQSVEPARRMQSIIRRSLKQIACVDPGNLSNENVVKMNATKSLLGALHECSKPVNVERIESKSEALIPVGKVLELFK